MERNEIGFEEGCVNFATKKKGVDISVGLCGFGKQSIGDRNSWPI
jgi:hypothetical protein